MSDKRLWLGNGYVGVGSELTLRGGYNGTAKVVDIRPIKEISSGTLLIDPRTLELVHASGFYNESHHISYSDSTMDGCCMADEGFPVITLGTGDSV